MEDFIFIVGFLIFVAIMSVPTAWFAHIVWHMIMIGWGS